VSERLAQRSIESFQQAGKNSCIMSYGEKSIGKSKRLGTLPRLVGGNADSVTETIVKRAFEMMEEGGTF
jgi:hypothetical protein